MFFAYQLSELRKVSCGGGHTLLSDMGQPQLRFFAETASHDHVHDGTWLDNVDWPGVLHDADLDMDIVIAQDKSAEAFDAALREIRCDYCSSLLDLAGRHSNGDIVVMAESPEHAIVAPAIETLIRDKLIDLGVPTAENLFPTGTHAMYSYRLMLRLAWPQDLTARRRHAVDHDRRWWSRPQT